MNDLKSVFSIPEVTLPWQPIFCQFCGRKRPPVCGLDEFAGVLRQRYRPPRLGLWAGPKKTPSQHPPWQWLCGHGLIHAHPWLRHWNHDSLVVSKSRSSSKQLGLWCYVAEVLHEDRQPICAVLDLDGPSRLRRAPRERRADAVTVRRHVT